MLYFSFHFILVFTSELGKVSHFSSRLFVSSNLWKTGGGKIGFGFLSVKLSVFWVLGFSIPHCKMIFGFFFFWFWFSIVLF